MEVGWNDNSCPTKMDSTDEWKINVICKKGKIEQRKKKCPNNYFLILTSLTEIILDTLPLTKTLLADDYSLTWKKKVQWTCIFGIDEEN